MDWVGNVENFFRFLAIVVEDRVTMAVFHLKGQARMSYKVLYNDEGPVDWDRFKNAIFAGFGSPYKNHFGELS